MFYYNCRMLMSRMPAQIFIPLFILTCLSACTNELSKKNIMASDDVLQPEPGITEIFTPTPYNVSETAQVPTNDVEILSFRVIHRYHHDSGAFTEGLVIQGNMLYETTGLFGRSSIRKNDLESGKIQKIRYLSNEYFGEGLTIIDEKMIWITWQSNIGFVYDLNSFEVINNFSYDHEGWGLANDGNRLFMSDGTDVIHILDPETLLETGVMQVTNNGTPVNKINELEFIEGNLFANIWLTNNIARIDPDTGNITGWLDLTSLSDNFKNSPYSVNVLNGIAYNQDTKQIYVTGKFWPYIFEIQITSPK